MDEETKENPERRRELSEVQRFAVRAARERFLEAQSILNRMVTAVMKEHSINGAEIDDWQFIDNFKFIEKKKAAQGKGE